MRQIAVWAFVTTVRDRTVEIHKGDVGDPEINFAASSALPTQPFDGCFEFSKPLKLDVAVAIRGRGCAQTFRSETQGPWA